MRTSRRGFLKTLGGVALFSIVPRHVLGNGYIAPSDQLTKGIIGTGGVVNDVQSLAIAFLSDISYTLPVSDIYTLRSYTKVLSLT